MVSVDKGDHTVRSPLCPLNPLFLEMLPQHIIFHFASRDGPVKEHRGPCELEYTQEEPWRSGCYSTFCPPRSPSEIEEETAYDDVTSAYIRRMADVGIWTVRDELVVFPDGELEGEVISHVAITNDT